MSEHDLQIQCVCRRSAPQSRAHYDSGIAQRSWRTIETARRNAKVTITGAGRKAPTDETHRVDRNLRRNDASEKGMQCAAVVTKGSALVTVVVMGLVSTMLVMRVLVMDMQNKSVRDCLRMSARGRHDSRQLRDQKQADQQADKATYRPEPLHQGLDPTPQATALQVEAVRSIVNAGANPAPILAMEPIALCPI
jgi:hypothetical protein